MDSGRRVMHLRRVRTSQANEQLVADLHLIANEKLALAEAMASIEKMEAKLFEDMKKARTKHIECALAIADISAPASRGTNTIDPRKYHKAVSEKDFFSSIVVSNTAAKKILGTREVERISTFTPGKDKEECLTVSLVPDKSKSRK